MPHIEKREGAEGVRYRARYRDPTGRERVRSFAKKKDAERFLATQEADKARGQWLDPSAGRVTFKEYATAWQAAQMHRPTTAQSVDNALRVHLLPVFGKRALASIRPTEVRQFVRDSSQTLAPATVHRLHAFLAMILKAAVEDQLIARSPAVGTAPPTPQRRAVNALTSEQIAALIAATPARYRALVALGAGTGMRQGECFGTVLAAPGRSGLDLLRRRIDVVRQVELAGGPAVLVERVKTPKSRRTIPLPTSLAGMLAGHLAAFPAREDGVVFTNTRGGLLRRGGFNEVFGAAVERVGLPDGVTFHWLRHSFASHMIAGGANVLELQRLLGHASIQETVDTYGSLMPDQEETSRARMEQVFATALRVETA